MLAQLQRSFPEEGDYLFEPKWDGFRALAFLSGSEVILQSREKRPLQRYFPELVEAIGKQLGSDLVLDGEIVIAGPNGLDFSTLQLRLHPAASRVKRLAAEVPASFIAFDLLADGDEDLRSLGTLQRRKRLEALLRNVAPPVYVTPCTTDRAQAKDWFMRFEGAGFDGVMAKGLDAPYLPGRRTMLKIKHRRTAECVVAGFRWHKEGLGQRVGSLLLGLFDHHDTLHHVGVTSSFKKKERERLVEELAPLRQDAFESHPWGSWASPNHGGTRHPGMVSRWSGNKDLSWEPLRVERVCEVAYDHLQDRRFRHGTTFIRWRLDRSPSSCRFDQLDKVPPIELSKIFSGYSSSEEPDAHSEEGS